MNAHVPSFGHMGIDFQPRPGGRKGVGLVVVVILHLLIGWALVSGLARKAVEVVKKPIQMAVLPELAPPPPPPPPPPPKIEKIQQAPKVQAPPPPYVPPPDIAPPVQPTAPVIQAVQAEPPKELPVIAPPPPPAPPAPVVQRAEVSVACPGYQAVLRGALSGAFESVGVEGTVKVLLRVKGNQVVDVTPQGGPRGYYRYVTAAARKMHCSASGADELLVPLDVVFREE